MLQASGLQTGPLPCDSCVAHLTIPLSDAASADYNYMCAHVVAGQAYLDATIVAAGTVRSAAADSGSVVECSVSQTGTYVVGRVLRPVETPAQGVPTTEATTNSARQGLAPEGVPAVVGGVVGGVVGAVLVAAVALVIINRR